MNKLIIIRGPSGSGKSTKAREILAENPGMLHYEADMFFYDKEGKYNFDAKKLKYAHAWCQRKVAEGLERGQSVIVSNTSIRIWEVNTYIEIAKNRGVPYEILTMKGRYQNVHGCPQDKVDEMWKNLADIPDTYQSSSEVLTGHIRPGVINIVEASFTPSGGNCTCKDCGCRMIGRPGDDQCSDCGFPLMKKATDAARKAVVERHFEQTGERKTIGEILRGECDL